MTDPAVPFSRNFDLGCISDSRSETLEPTPEQRARIAEWAGLSGLESLTARLKLSRLADDFYAYDAQLEADVVQPCVVTLEPVRSHVSRSFARRYRVLPPRRGKVQFTMADAVVDPEDDDTETVANPFIDLAAPMLEELSLGLDPYPRAPGAQLEVQAEVEDIPENPFAVLDVLKQKGGPGRARKR
jgi:uncharacterized metal-binding protein YceD (DUF177 family)